jgi:trk system potassium uptake protein
MFTGGTTGSTSGGIKIARLLLITKNSRQELKRLIHPSGFIPVRLDKRIIPQTTIYNLLVFITIYFLLICFSAFIISFMDYDMVNSFSTAASMVANIGPAIGGHGPLTNYASMPMTGKMFLAGLMFLGRLELLTVMILFSRSFYRH